MSDPTSSTDPIQPPAEPAGGEVPAAPSATPSPAPPQVPYPQQEYPQQPYPPQAPQGADQQGPYQQGAYQQGPYQQGPYQQGAYPAGAYIQPYPKNDLAVWSFVLGLAGFVLGCMLFTGIPAVIVGRNAQRAVAAGEANNSGLATAGIILGWVSIALTAVAVVLFGVLLALGIAIPLVADQASSVG
ncbi:DUF4190 domain-containing protein [Cellulomonas soli]|uniref:DUF4190 domain-containing protein n=1 Tax=Cellulomonas soli TaxID=931535 RepID=A0A512PHE2_9CELL|nr:DUF4190 domain-containing protein [Cellulomonas soli]NYI60806.1 hypothetical protein [Cellulomonas soli]GEP70610.1 hypothetical protein CSO01_33250 [Cellulomonas soli]